MNLAGKILSFYKSLDPPVYLPYGVEIMNPYMDQGVWDYVDRFYRQYYSDNRSRILLIGINPGRFGGGVTGIPFTDPIRLQDNCSIENPFDKRPELSSRFIYAMIDELNGPDKFYRSFYITAVSPLGFIRDGKNLNYYDIPSLESNWEPFMAGALKEQIEFCGNAKIAFSIGMGKNIEYLNRLNKKYNLVDELIALPHPRWVMQYRLKRINEFLEEYKARLGPFLSD